MERIIINTQNLKNNISELRNLANETTTQNVNLIALNLSSSQGDVRDELISLYNTFKDCDELLSKLIITTADFMKNTADNYKDSDDFSANLFNIQIQ